MSLRPTVGVLASRVRLEEKAILASLDAAGIDAMVLDTRRLVFSTGQPWSGPRVVLNREVGQVRALYAAHALEARGVTVLNSGDATRVCGDKWLTTTALVAAGVPTPATSLALTTHEGLPAIEDIGYPAVVKPLVGSWGRLVTKVSSPETAAAVMEHLDALPHPTSHLVYAQQAVPRADYDIRVIVIDGVAIAASRRTSDDFRTNVARGGISSPLPLTSPISELAVAAADAVGATIAGVDLICDQDGHLWVIEVNDRVEFKGLQQAHSEHIDIAAAIVEALIKPRENAA